MTTESLAELVRFADDTYGFRWHNHVACFIVTDDGVILIDPLGQENPRTPSLIKEAVRSVTDQPVKYVIYSHWGGDHGMGGAAFADTAQFVGHRNSVHRIAKLNDPASPQPGITFSEKTSVELGGKRIDLYPTDLYDDDDYFVIHHPASRMAMLVDIVQPRNIPFRNMLGNPDRIVERLQWIHDTLDFDALVSGHSLPHMTATKQDVAEQRQYYLDLSQAIDAARKAGHADGSAEMTNAVRASLDPTYSVWRRYPDMLEENIQGMIGWRAGKVLRTT